MKRSTLIQKVAENIKPILNNDLTSDIGLTSYGTEKLVDIVLIELEKAGILPPEILKKDPGHFPGDQFEYKVNEWETE